MSLLDFFRTRKTIRALEDKLEAAHDRIALLEEDRRYQFGLVDHFKRQRDDARVSIVELEATMLEIIGELDECLNADECSDGSR